MCPNNPQAGQLVSLVYTKVRCDQQDMGHDPNPQTGRLVSFERLNCVFTCMCLRVCQIQPPTQQLGLLGHGIYNPQGGRLVSRVGHGYNPQPRLDATGS